MRLLGIETSCDETAAAIVKYHRGRFSVLSNVVYSQVAKHSKTGGVVPEVAAREHAVKIVPVLDRAMRLANVTQHTIDALAVTAGPGLMTTLSVGVEAARVLAALWKKPLLPINHIEAHSISPLIMNEPVRFPAMSLVVSGGHSELHLVRSPTSIRCVGRTLDDAAGEAFDKVAKLLHLGYPGGPAVAKSAGKGNRFAYKLPRPMLMTRNHDLSFAGLKTAVMYRVMKRKVSIPNMAASFQQAVVDVLVKKTVDAARAFRVRSVFLSGGVAANRELRRQLAHTISEMTNCSFHVPAFEYCTDNAAMIAARATFLFGKRKRWPWQRVKADANWEVW